MPPPKDPIKYKKYIERQSKSHIGQKAWNIGIPMREESIKKLKISLKGRVSPNKGKEFSKEHKRSLSIAKLGNQYKKGWVAPQETRIKASISAINRYQTSVHPWVGRHHKPSTIEKLSLAKIGQKPTDETRAKLRYKRSFRILPQKDTKPERMMQIALSLNGIKFEKHRRIKLGKSWHQVDIFIEPNICVEVDGDYWHRRPENALRDIRINHNLNLLGYIVIRLWESDIKKDTQFCAENVMKMIKERMELRK